MVRLQLIRGGQYAKLALGHYYYPVDFVGVRAGYSYIGRVDLHFTCGSTNSGNHLAGAASKN